MGLILRTLIAILLVMGLILIGTTGFMVLEPIYEMSTQWDGAESQGWTSNNVIMLFAAFGLLSLVLVLLLWWVVGDLVQDTRQREQDIRFR